MNRRRSKRSALSIFQWLFKSIAIVLGIVPQVPRIRRIATKRSGNTTLRRNKGLSRQSRQKQLRTKDRDSRSVVDFTNGCELSSVQISNSNNNRSLASEDYQRRILCFQVDSDQIASRLESLVAHDTSILKDTRIIDLQELLTFIRSTTVQSTQEDASTMTTLDPYCCGPSSCLRFMPQSVNARRLKALEFIRIFLEKGKEDLCRHLIDVEHLCQRKTTAVYQMISQFLDIVSHIEHGKK